MADILSSVCSKVSIATAQICHRCMKAVTDNIKINEHPCVPIKLYLPNQMVDQMKLNLWEQETSLIIQRDQRCDARRAYGSHQVGQGQQHLMGKCEPKPDKKEQVWKRLGKNDWCKGPELELVQGIKARLMIAVAHPHDCSQLSVIQKIKCPLLASAGIACRWCTEGKTPRSAQDTAESLDKPIQRWSYDLCCCEHLPPQILTEVTPESWATRPSSAETPGV